MFKKNKIVNFIFALFSFANFIFFVPLTVEAQVVLGVAGERCDDSTPCGQGLLCQSDKCCVPNSTGANACAQSPGGNGSATCNTSATTSGTCESSGGRWTAKWECVCRLSRDPSKCNPSAKSMDACIDSTGYWTDNGSCSCSGSGGGGGGSSLACPDGLVKDPKSNLCLPPSALCTGEGISCSSSISELIVRVIKILLTLSGMVSVLFVILGGFWYMTSGGNEEQAEKGKSTLTNFFLGLVLILMAYAIVTIVNTIVTAGK